MGKTIRLLEQQQQQQQQHQTSATTATKNIGGSSAAAAAAVAAAAAAAAYVSAAAAVTAAFAAAVAAAAATAVAAAAAATPTAILEVLVGNPLPCLACNTSLSLCLSRSLSLSLYLTFKSRLAHLLTQLFLRTRFGHDKHIAKVSWLACPCIGTPFTYRDGAECVAKSHAEEVCIAHYIHRQQLRRLPALLRRLIVRTSCFKVFRLLDQTKDGLRGSLRGWRHHGRH